MSELNTRGVVIKYNKYIELYNKYIELYDKYIELYDKYYSNWLIQFIQII